MYIKGPETRKCPPEFQERLTRMFGRNQFGDPHFKIVWGQSQFIRMGNVWRDSRGNERTGYRDRYQAAGQACWVIMRWKQPIEYGSPNAYYSNTYDATTDLYFLGDYPWKGRYEVVQPLISKEFVGDQLVIEHFPLSHYLIDTIIPMMIAFQRLSRAEQQAAQQAAKVLEEKVETERIADQMEDKAPSWWGPVSYGNQGCRTSLLDRKMHQIQQVWDRMARRGRKPVYSRGMSQGNRPARTN